MVNKVDAGGQSRGEIMVKKKRKFEHALQDLEAIVDRLDGDETDLDDAIDLFENVFELTTILAMVRQTVFCGGG